MMKRSKLSMEVAYDSDSSNASSDDNTGFLDNPADGDLEFGSSSHRRKRRKHTGHDAKESAALGVFGSESEDEYKDYGRSQKSKRGFRSLRDGGMSFVKTGAKQLEDDGDEEMEDEEEGEDDNEGNRKREDFSVEATAGLRDLGTRRGTDGYSEEDGEDDDQTRPNGLGSTARTVLGSSSSLGFQKAGDTMDVDSENPSLDDRPKIGLGGSPFKPRIFAPRSVGTKTAATSGTATPNSMDGHRGLGFQSAGTSSLEQSPQPEPLRTGLGLSRNGVGLGFKKAGTIDSDDLQNQPLPQDHAELEEERYTSSNMTAPLGKGFVSSIRQNAMSFTPAAFDEDDEPTGENLKARPSFTDVKPGRGKKGKEGTQVNAESFAARMMAKMGYVSGQGLGKTGEGRLAPVDTQLRPTRVGLGAVREKTEQAKKEEKRAKILKGEVPSDSDSEKERKARKKKKGKGVSTGDTTGGSGTSTPARRKPKFKTAEEMSRELEGLNVPSALMNIIDLTGKEARTLEVGSPGIMAGADHGVAEDENAKIARLARRELEDFAKEWKRLQERKKFIRQEEIRMMEDVDEQAESCKALHGIVDLTSSLTIDMSGIESRNGFEDRIATLASKLESLQFKYRNEVEVYNLSEVAVAAFHPLFKSALSDWDPLLDPVFLLEHIQKLRQLFNVRTMEDIEASLAATGYSEKSGKRSTHYESMMYNIWLPKIRSTINNTWDVHDPTPILTILETWNSVLPPFIHANILDQLILPKLKSAVSTWNPRTSSKKKSSTPPPHVWVFPWLPHLSSHMDELVREVKRKFKVIIDKWDLSKGLIDGLEAWREVFGHGELEKMLITHLLPRLADLLRRKFEVNPADQDLVALESVLVWHEFFRLSTFSQLLEAEFFPKWINTLYTWLTMENSNFEEVSEWYRWWSGVFPESIRQAPQVRQEFQKGLDMMNQALEVEAGKDIASTLVPPSSGPTRPIRPSPPAPTSASKPRKAVDGHGKSGDGVPTETTFREFVEEWCSEHGLILMPLRKAHDTSGQPLFRITESASGSGGVLCYFFQDVVWAQDRKRKEIFEPLSLEKVEQRIEAAHH